MRSSNGPVLLCLLLLLLVAGGCRTPAPDACVTAPTPVAGASETLLKSRSRSESTVPVRSSTGPVPSRLLLLLLLAAGCRTPAPDACVTAPPPVAGASETFWMSIALLPAAGPDSREAVAAGRAGRGPDGPSGATVDILDARTGEPIFELRGTGVPGGFGYCLAATPSPGGGLLLVGSPSPWGAGTVHEYSCRDGSEVGVLGEPEGFKWFGRSVAWIGDVDGDGTGDIAVCASGAALPDGGSHAGAVLAYSGATLKPLWVARGAAPRECFGDSLLVCPDLDGDGTPDLAVGNMGISLGENGRSRSVVTALSGATGKTLWRAERESRAIASTVAMEVCRDRDGDGVADLLVLRWQDLGPGGTSHVLEILSGATGVLLTPDDGFPGTLADGEKINLVGDRDGDGLPERVRRDTHDVPGIPLHSRATYLPSRDPAQSVSLCAEGIDPLHGSLLEAPAGRTGREGIAVLAQDGGLLVVLSPRDGRVLWTRRAGAAAGYGPSGEFRVPEEPGELQELRTLLVEIEMDLVEIDRALTDGKADRARVAGRRVEGGLPRAESLADAVRAKMRERGSDPLSGMAFEKEQATLVRLGDCWIRVREELR